MTTATANDYVLPSIVTVNGTFAVTVYSEFATLTAPTIQTILTLGDVTESANITVGISEVENMTIEVRDDYSATTEGFWYAALQGECWIKITLDEGAGATHFFFGTVDKPTVEWTEHAIVGSLRVRTASFSLIAMSKKIFDSSIDDWIAQVLAICYDLELTAPAIGLPTHVVKVTELFAAMLVSSGLNSQYGSLIPPWDTDVELLTGTQAEMNYTEGVNTYEVDEIYVPVKYCVSTSPTVVGTCQYFDVAGVNCLSQQSDGTGYYGSMQALISDLLMNLGLIMRITYDADSTHHKIKLMYRHDVYTGALTFANEAKSSKIEFSQQIIGDAAKATDLADPDKYAWISKKYRPVLTVYDAGVETSAADARVEFDLDAKCVFISDENIPASPNGTANHSLLHWSGVADEDVTYIDGVGYYSTAAADMAGYTIGDGLDLERAVCSYQYERFIRYFKTITRTYGPMSATDTTTTHTHLSIMKRTQINDLGENVYYFANSVTKKPMSAEVTVEWQEED